MKRLSIIIFSFCLCLSVLGKSNSVAELLNVPGVMKKDYESVKKGTPVTFIRIYEGKGDYAQTEYLQAVMNVDNMQMSIPLSELFSYVELKPQSKDSYWQLAQLKANLLKYRMKKGTQLELRKEMVEDANDYVHDLEQSNLIYDDVVLEDYIHCLLLDILPNEMLVNTGNPLQVKIYKSPSPDIILLSNGCLLLSTGMISALDNEDELVAILSREVSHYVLDHSVINYNKNIARMNRAQFWGGVLNAAMGAVDDALTEKYEYYPTGALYIASDVVNALICDDVEKRMGLDYSEKQEKESDKMALGFLEFSGKDKNALPSALERIGNYYVQENDMLPLKRWNSLGTLMTRLTNMKPYNIMEQNPVYTKKTFSVVNFNAQTQIYNKKYESALRLIQKNERNGFAGVDDYILKANALMKLSNTEQTNDECLSYLDKAENMAGGADVDAQKMRILLFLREKKRYAAIDALNNYKKVLDDICKKDHTQQEDSWLLNEQNWVKHTLGTLSL